MKARIIKAPYPVPDIPGYKRLFLAGSIDMGHAEDWQTRVTNELLNTDIIICNPRGDNWNSSWKQNIDDPQFRQQVEWELENQEKADIILMVLTADSKAPITLLELGLFGRSGKMIVCCHKDFYRKGNIDVVCKRYKIKQVDTIEEAIKIIKEL